MVGLGHGARWVKAHMVMGLDLPMPVTRMLKTPLRKFRADCV